MKFEGKQYAWLNQQEMNSPDTPSFQVLKQVLSDDGSHTVLVEFVSEINKDGLLHEAAIILGSLIDNHAIDKLPGYGIISRAEDLLKEIS